MWDQFTSSLRDSVNFLKNINFKGYPEEGPLQIMFNNKSLDLDLVIKSIPREDSSRRKLLKSILIDDLIKNGSWEKESFISYLRTLLCRYNKNFTRKQNYGVFELEPLLERFTNEMDMRVLMEEYEEIESQYIFLNDFFIEDYYKAVSIIGYFYVFYLMFSIKSYWNQTLTNNKFSANESINSRILTGNMEFITSLIEYYLDSGCDCETLDKRFFIENYKNFSIYLDRLYFIQQYSYFIQETETNMEGDNYLCSSKLDMFLAFALDFQPLENRTDQQASLRFESSMKEVIKDSFFTVNKKANLKGKQLISLLNDIIYFRLQRDKEFTEKKKKIIATLDFELLNKIAETYQEIVTNCKNLEKDHAFRRNNQKLYLEKITLNSKLIQTLYSLLVCSNIGSDNYEKQKELSLKLREFSVEKLDKLLY